MPVNKQPPDNPGGMAQGPSVLARGGGGTEGNAGSSFVASSGAEEKRLQRKQFEGQRSRHGTHAVVWRGGEGPAGCSGVVAQACTEAYTAAAAARPTPSCASLLLGVCLLLHRGLAGRDTSKGGILDAEDPIQHILHCTGQGTGRRDGEARVACTGTDQHGGVCSQARPARQEAPACALPAAPARPPRTSLVGGGGARGDADGQRALLQPGRRLHQLTVRQLVRDLWRQRGGVGWRAAAAVSRSGSGGGWRQAAQARVQAAGGRALLASTSMRAAESTQKEGMLASSPISCGRRAGRGGQGEGSRGWRTGHGMAQATQGGLRMQRRPTRHPPACGCTQTPSRAPAGATCLTS